jgi:CelD/BcsL family acetyltransferase involved in cellulose biosynthesis
MTQGPQFCAFDAPCIDTVEIHDSMSGNLLAIYDGLMKADFSTPFQNRAWLQSWQEHVGKPSAVMPVMVIGRHAGKPNFAMPLSRQNYRGLRTLTWQGQTLDDYCGPVGSQHALQSLSETHVHSLFKLIATAVGGVDVVRLEKQRASYGACLNPFVSDSSIRYHVATHRTRLGSNWEEYLSSKRSAKSRSRMRSKFKSLCKMGKVSMRFSQNPQDAAKLVSLGLEMKSRQLSARGHPNPFASPLVQEHLVNSFAGQCPTETWVASLFLDEKPLAISYGFKNPQSWLLYQVAMENGEYDAFSPGSHLIMFIMQHCCEQNVQEFDFSLGDEAYKMDWCEISEPLFTSILPLTPKGTLASFGMRFAAFSRLSIASNSKIYDAAKNLKLKIDTNLNLGKLH